MRMNVWMTCLAIGLAFAVTAEAQPGGGRGGRGGGGMGRGGGFGRGGILMIAGNDAVQKDLGLSTDDAAKVKEVTDAYGTAMRESFTGGGNFRDMSEEERTKAREKMQETGKALVEKYLPKLKAALSADQFTRLQQINWQNMGVAAYSDDEVVKALTITKDQTEKITQVNEEFGPKFREAFTPGQPPDMEKMGALQKEQKAKVTEVLTKDQNDKFATLVGKPFDVAQLRGGFGRGGGGGGGGGGAGGAGGRPKRPQTKSDNT